MLSKVISASVTGIDANIVQVETDVSNGIPAFIMTGHVGAGVREAGERVRTAIKNIGYKLPCAKIVVNVSPASIRKSGTMFDLPVAVGILCDMEIIRADRLDKTLIVGELSLDGTINPICGVMAIVDEARRQGVESCIVPADNMEEAQMIHGISIYGARNLEEVIAILGSDNLSLEAPDLHTYDAMQDSSLKNINVNHAIGDESLTDSKVESDFDDVKGQYAAKRAILIAAAGRHNILMSGPPGSGKTLLASRIPTILSELNEQELIDVYKIYSVAGKISDIRDHTSKRPFRSPHHTITQAALLGGGSVPVPGEITLAHNGVLFLDELTKFKGTVLECLRQPIEEKKITIIRNGVICHFPTDFMLVAAMNPCKCGYYPDRNMCKCTELDIIRHVGKLSKPFLDRFDLAVHIDKPLYGELSGGAEYKINRMLHKIREGQDTYSASLNSQMMNEKVMKAFAIQQKRYAKTGIMYNSQLDMAQIRKYCTLDMEADNLMKDAYERYNLSARGYGKVLKVARTIADIEGSENIKINHLSEAICFRNIDLEG